jgi:hypothetical protein
MKRHNRSISDILSPALAAVALSVFIAGCTPSDSSVDVSSSSSSSSEAMMTSSSAMNASSAGMPSSVSSAMMPASSASMRDDSAYNDGTYSADGVYRSPAGAEEIHVTVTLEDDIITSAQVESTATNPKSKQMQSQFIAGFSTYVVGKPIDELSLGVVNGSSLTPKGFMDAVAKIKAEASAS